MNDTSNKFKEIHFSFLRSVSPAKRIKIMRSLTKMTIELSRRAISRSYPEYTQDQLNREFVKLHYGEELANRLLKDHS